MTNTIIICFFFRLASKYWNTKSIHLTRMKAQLKIPWMSHDMNSYFRWWRDQYGIKSLWKKTRKWPMKKSEKRRRKNEIHEDRWKDRKIQCVTVNWKKKTRGDEDIDLNVIIKYIIKIIYESWWRTLIIFRKDTGYRTTITNWYSSWDEIHVCQIIFDVKVIMSLTFFLDLKMKESFCTIRITTISISIDSIHLIKNYMSLRKTSWSVKKEVITWRQLQLIPAHSYYSFSSAS